LVKLRGSGDEPRADARAAVRVGHDDLRDAGSSARRRRVGGRRVADVEIHA
jgi:hypothetical protein